MTSATPATSQRATRKPSSTARVAVALWSSGLLREEATGVHREDAVAHAAGEIEFTEMLQRRQQRRSPGPSTLS